MRNITTAQQAVVSSGVQAEHVRLWVMDGGNIWRDLTTWPGFNAVKEVSWKANINDPHKTFDATLAREVFNLSLAPLVEQSPLNRGFSHSNGYDPLLKVNREVKIEVAIVPMDAEPSEADWMEKFHGRIDQLDSARGDEVSISGRDMGGRLAQQYIKKERVYAFGEDGGAMVSMRVWSPEMTVAVGDYVIPASRGEDDPGYNKFFKADTAGVTGTTEPTWSTGANITDGTARWDYVAAPTLTGYPVQDVIQKILDDNRLQGDPRVTLRVIGDPLWQVTEFQQNRGFTLEAVRALATQIGWDTRYLWNESDGEFQLTLYEPSRDDPPVLHTFSTSDYEAPTRLAEDIATIRNSVLVIYKDKADTWPDGTPKRKEVTASDPDSIDELGELWSELQEDENGNIDTEAEAERLAASFISDCAWPTAEVGVPLTRGFPWVELNDFYEFEPDNVRSSVPLQLAVMSWSQSFQSGTLKTTLELRGTPSIGHEVHIAKERHPGKPPKNFGHRLEHFTAPQTVKPEFSQIVGGFQVDFPFVSNSKKDNLLAEYEVHVSQTPGFGPDDTTLMGVIQGTSQSMPYQNPGEGYYACVVPRWYNAGQLVRGQPSARQAVTAGRASAGHIHDGIAIGDYPLNGGFETRLNTAGLPDHWSLYTGAYSTNVEVMEDGNGVSGRRYIRLKNGGVRSAVYPMLQEANESSRRGSMYRFHWWRKAGSSAAGTYSALIRVLDYQNAEVAILTASSAVAIDKVGHWVREELFCRLREGDASARSLQLIISGGSTSSNAHIDIDEVRCQYLGSAWYEVGDTTYFTENYEAVPGFANSWVNDTGLTVAFRKDQFGWLELKGAMRNGTIGATAFTLPVGFRPKSQKRVAVMTGSGVTGELQINTNGTVVPATGSNSWVSLDGIRIPLTDVATTLVG